MAPGCRNRSAAQISSGKTTYARFVSRENTSALTPTVRAASAAASGARPGTRVNGHHVTATSSTGATSRTPPMSPSHQMRHADARSPASITPVTSRLKPPIVALIVVLATPAKNTSASTSRTRSSAGLKPATRRSRYAPATASSVFPHVIPTVAASGIPVQEFARNAPSATPGQNRGPPSTSAVSASPVGGQIAVMVDVSYA